MKKQILLFILPLFFICACLFINVGCDLSHKHYLDNYGVCKNCGKDAAVNLTRDSNGEYFSTETYCSTNDFSYFKFVASGEEFITICVEEISANVDYISLYTKNVSNLSLSHVSGENSYFYSNKLTEGEIYYIKVKVSTAGNIKIKVSSYIMS